MALTCPVDFDIAGLRDRVQRTYEQMAQRPSGDFHFHRGGGYAVSTLGYEAEEVARLPTICTDRFAGAGNPHLVGPYMPGDVILDHACGAAMDLLMATRRAGSFSRGIGVDMTPAMQDCARLAANEAGLAHRVEIRSGLFEALPVANASIDVALSNGVINLSPDKRRAFRELFRVLRPGGRLHLADLVLQQQLTVDRRSDPELWAAGIGGALSEPELVELAMASGFRDCALISRHDCFAGTRAAAGLGRAMRVVGVSFFARKPFS
jgi:SAM-dependent methyltransferase